MAKENMLFAMHMTKHKRDSNNNMMLLSACRPPSMKHPPPNFYKNLHS